MAGILNAGLGYYLIRTGRRTNSLILEANGKHVLTDSWTSFGVVGGLGLVLLTHWKPFDPLVAIAVAVNILWSGGRLVWRSAVGLLDYSDPQAGKKIREQMDALCAELDIQYHGVRFRTTGYRQIIEVHLLFPRLTSVSEAHGLATILEERLQEELGMPAEVVTHLEALEDHAESIITCTTPENRSEPCGKQKISTRRSGRQRIALGMILPILRRGDVLPYNFTQHRAIAAGIEQLAAGC